VLRDEGRENADAVDSQTSEIPALKRFSAPGQQKTKMTGELHANPSMGHMKKGFKRITPTQATNIRKQVSL
jgi:hypothetical protein